MFRYNVTDVNIYTSVLHNVLDSDLMYYYIVAQLLYQMLLVDGGNEYIDRFDNVVNHL